MYGIKDGVVSADFTQIGNKPGLIKTLKKYTRKDLRTIQAALANTNPIPIPIEICRLFSVDHAEVSNAFLRLLAELDAAQAKYRLYLDGVEEPSSYILNRIRAFGTDGCETWR